MNFVSGQKEGGWAASDCRQSRTAHLLETLVDAVGRGRLLPAIHNVPDIVALLGLDTMNLVKDPFARNGVPRTAQLSLGGE